MEERTNFVHDTISISGVRPEDFDVDTLPIELRFVCVIERAGGKRRLFF